MTTKLLKLLTLAGVLSCCLVSQTQAQSRFTRYVTNVADLVKINPAGNDRLYELFGYYTAGDGGGGLFYWTPGDTTTTNLGTVFASTYPGASGRYLRRVDGNYDLAWFGGKADAAYDNYAAITNALDVIRLANGGVLRIPNGTNLFSKTVSLPNAGNTLAIVGDRRDAALLRYTGTSNVMVASVAGAVAGGYEFRGWTLDGTGNSNTNVNYALTITNLASRELLIRDFKVHNFANATGIWVDQSHTVLFENVLIDYCAHAADFGAPGLSSDHYFNAGNLIAFSAENCTATDWTVRFQNAIETSWVGGTVEANQAGILVMEDSDAFNYLNVYHELNGTNTPVVTIDESKGALIAGCEFNNASLNTNVVAIRLGSNSYSSQGGGFRIRDNVFKSFHGFTIEIGGAASGLGPRDPLLDGNSYWDCNQITGDPLKWTDPLESGQLIRRELGGEYIYNAAGVKLANTLGTITGSAPVIYDATGATNYGFSLPQSSTANLPNTTKNALIYDYTIGRFRATTNGIIWNILGYGDGNVQSVTGSTGVLNTVTFWTGNGSQLSTNSIIYVTSDSVGINVTTNIPTSTKLWVDAGGTNNIEGTSSTLVIRNDGIATNANVAEFISDAGGAFAQFRNDGSVRLSRTATNKFVYANGFSVLEGRDAVESLALDVDMDSIFSLDAATGPVTMSADDPGASRIVMWDDVDNSLVYAVVGANLSYDAASNTLSATGGGGSGSVTNFSVGAMSPIFTVSDPTTFPLLAPVDPGATRLWGWDDTDGVAQQITIGSGLSYDAPSNTISATAGGGGTVTDVLSGNITNLWTVGIATSTTTPTFTFTRVDPGADRIVIFDNTNDQYVQAVIGSGLSYDAGTDTLTATGGSGDITSVGDVTSGAAFDGTQGTILTFNNAGGDGAFSYDGTSFLLTHPLDYGAAGVRLSGDGDGALTFLGLGNGADEALTLNLDDTANEAVFSSSTSVTNLNLSANTLSLSVPNFAYDATAWNGLQTVPTRDDIRDLVLGLGVINTNGLEGWQAVGSGSDFNYTIGTDTYEEIAFGTSGPSFTLTNAGKYQLAINIGAFDAGSFRQDFFLTNTTAGTFVSGSQSGGLVSSQEERIPIIVQVTTTSANNNFEIWGKTANATYTSAGVTATNTVVDVIYLGNPTNTGEPVSFIAAASDEITALTTGTNKVRFRLPHAMTLTAVRASLTTAQTAGSILTIDINENGTSVLSTKITIDATETTSVTAATPPVISDSALADDGIITVDIDQVGTSPAGLKVTLIGTR